MRSYKGARHPSSHPIQAVILRRQAFRRRRTQARRAMPRVVCEAINRGVWRASKLERVSAARREPRRNAYPPVQAEQSSAVQLVSRARSLSQDTIGRCMTTWATRLGLNREALLHSARTAVAAVLSLMVARALKLAEFYWAPISTIVILLSVTDPLALAWQRFAGTAV